MLTSRVTYLNLLDQAHYLKKETDIQAVSYFLECLKQSKVGHTFLSGNIFFVMDYTRRKYVLINAPIEDFIGYHPRDFLEGGLDFVIDAFHKNDFAVFNEKCVCSSMEILKHSPQEEHSSFVFEMNYRLSNKEGKFIEVLQKSSYITDTITGLPVYSFGICTDISLYKKDASMVQAIYKYDQTNIHNNYKRIATHYFYPDIEETFLTKKEKEVLLWIIEGFSTKQIAGKMKLSANTIANHRKNMLRKSNAKNVAELIGYAIKNKVV